MNKATEKCSLHTSKQSSNKMTALERIRKEEEEEEEVLGFYHQSRKGKEEEEEEEVLGFYHQNRKGKEEEEVLGFYHPE